jgi:hypothetical protein
MSSKDPRRLPGNGHVECTLTVPGYWRNLPKHERDAVGLRFWEVGRRTLEYWLTPRLDPARVHRRPGTHVVATDPGTSSDTVELTLSDSTRLAADYVVFACGYEVEIAKVPTCAAFCRRSRRPTGSRSSTRRSRRRRTVST